MDGYDVIITDPEKLEKALSKLDYALLYTCKADIHGVCVKLFTDSKKIYEMWSQNFWPMEENVRPHCRIFALSSDKPKIRVLYDPSSKIAAIYGCEYYGWIKSIALALASEFLFSSPSLENRRYPVHGSFLDFKGRGIAIIGAPKSGKTTLTYGLLTGQKGNFITDDWFFARFMDSGIQAYSSEKNSYVREDLAMSWPGLAHRLAHLAKDSHGRSIIDVKQLFGQSRMRSQSELSGVVLLIRDKKKPKLSRLDPDSALSFMLKNDFCNPHQLNRSSRRKKQNAEFFRLLFSKVPVWLLNTVETPTQSLARLSLIFKRL